MVFQNRNSGLLSLLAFALVEPSSEGFFYDDNFLSLKRKQKRTQMKTLTATQERKDIYKLIDETFETHKPIQILGKRRNAV